MHSRSILWIGVGLLLISCGYALYAFTAPRKVEGFLPLSIPVENSGVVESHKSVYKEEGVIQYTVNFTSTSAIEDLWRTYTTYLASAGFTLDELNTNREQGVIQARQPGQVLNILIYTMPGDTTSRVAIAYLEKR